MERIEERRNVKDYLLSKDNETIISEILGDRPWFFEHLDVNFTKWARRILRDIGLMEGALHVVGSGSLGFSLCPHKIGRPFCMASAVRPSDIDLALVHGQLFDSLWGEIRLADRMRNLGGPRERVDRIRIGIYFGHVTQKEIPVGTPASRKLRNVLDGISRESIFLGHPASARVYRRENDLWGYQEFSLVAARRALKTEEFVG